MRTFRYQDQDGDHEYTEEQILLEYFPYWAKKVREVGRAHMISAENCIEDWVAVNWAEEVTPPSKD